MAEQFGGGEFFGEAAAVHGDEGFVAAGTAFVDHLRDVFLARAAFAEDEDGELGGGHQFDVFIEALDGLAVAFHHELSGTEQLVNLLFRLECSDDFFLQHAGVNGFLEVVEGAEFHGRDGSLHFGVACHHDKGHGTFELFADPAHEEDAVTVGQSQVGEDEVELFRGDLFFRLGILGGQHNLVVVLLQPGLEHESKRGVVFHDQDRVFHHK